MELIYFVERSTNLGDHPAFNLLATKIPGQAGSTTYKDTTATGSTRYFYRVGVGE
jgi:hypothetical protein